MQASIWDIATGACTRVLSGHAGSVRAIRFSPTSPTLLVTASFLGQLRLWDLRTDSFVRAFQGHSRTVVSASFSHDGRALASGSSDCSARTWSIASGSCLAQLESLDAPILTTQFSGDGDCVLYGGSA